MRTIEKKLIAAIHAHVQFNMDNAAYEPTTKTVTLHGYKIARLDDKFNIKFSLAGWISIATRSWINVLANEFGHPGVHCVKGIAVSNGKPIDSSDWF